MPLHLNEGLDFLETALPLLNLYDNYGIVLNYPNSFHLYIVKFDANFDSIVLLKLLSCVVENENPTFTKHTPSLIGRLLFEGGIKCICVHEGTIYLHIRGYLT